jgi:hypothetical protein
LTQLVYDGLHGFIAVRATQKLVRNFLSNFIRQKFLFTLLRNANVILLNDFFISLLLRQTAPVIQVLMVGSQDLLDAIIYNRHFVAFSINLSSGWANTLIFLF